MNKVIMGMVMLVVLLSAFGKLAVSAPKKHVIDVPEGYETSLDEEGADAFHSLLDNPESRYFTINDYYNMRSEGSLHILPQFKTYQQTTEYTCGASSALMVLHFFGEDSYDEMQLAEVLHADPSRGVDPLEMKEFFSSLGWKVESHVGTDLYFDHPEEFADFLIRKMDSGIPVLVDWVDWSGHWQVIVGIDTCNELSVYDDVLILADPYDVTDAYQDGYYVFPLGRFFGMWYEGPCAQKMEPYQQSFVAASPELN